jgi:hypothetical protein
MVNRHLSQKRCANVKKIRRNKKYLSGFSNLPNKYKNTNLMKKTLTICLILALAFSTFSQEEVVKKIREEYEKYTKVIEELQQGNSNNFISPFNIKTTQVRPGLGPVTIEMTYYFDEKEKYSEPDHMDVPKHEGIIRKVVYTESMPSFTEYREFFYDPKGNFLFYYMKTNGYTCGENRLYFNNLKLIKIKSNPIDDAETEGMVTTKLPDYTRYAGKFTKDDLITEKAIIKQASHYKNVFRNLYDSM